MADLPQQSIQFPASQVATLLSLAGLTGLSGWLFRNHAKIAVLEREVVLLQEKCFAQDRHMQAQDTKIQLLENMAARFDEVAKSIPEIIRHLTHIDNSVSFMRGRLEHKRSTDTSED